MDIENKTVDLGEIGLRVQSSLANTILFENTHDSNLVSDIAQVDYLFGNEGETDLEYMEGLVPFVDDMYVFGFCREEQLVSKGKEDLVQEGYKRSSANRCCNTRCSFHCLARW